MSQQYWWSQRWYSDSSRMEQRWRLLLLPKYRTYCEPYHSDRGCLGLDDQSLSLSRSTGWRHRSYHWAWLLSNILSVPCTYLRCWRGLTHTIFLRQLVCLSVRRYLRREPGEFSACHFQWSMYLSDSERNSYRRSSKIVIEHFLIDLPMPFFSNQWFKIPNGNSFVRGRILLSVSFAILSYRPDNLSPYYLGWLEPLVWVPKCVESTRSDDSGNNDMGCQLEPLPMPFTNWLDWAHTSPWHSNLLSLSSTIES